MAETYADLLREVGLESPAARAARQPQRPAPQPNNPAARRYNENRERARINQPARDDFAARGFRQGAFTPPRNQVAELPVIVAESTGVPSAIRAFNGYRGAQNIDDMQAANGEAINGALGLGGWALGLRAPTRAAPRPAPREFPDFGLPEFDVYHGTTREVQGPLRRSLSGALGPGAYVARNPVTTETFAGTPRGREIHFGDGANILPMRARGRMATVDQWDSAVAQQMRRLRRRRPDSEVEDAAVQDLRQRGYHGVEDAERDFISVFDPGESLSSRFARAPTEPRQSLTPPPREIGPNGMPIAPRQPFRNSLRGGSADLNEAAALRANGNDAGNAGGGQFRRDALEGEVLSPLGRDLVAPPRVEPHITPQMKEELLRRGLPILEEGARYESARIQALLDAPEKRFVDNQYELVDKASGRVLSRHASNIEADDAWLAAYEGILAERNLGAPAARPALPDGGAGGRGQARVEPFKGGLRVVVPDATGAQYGFDLRESPTIVRIDQPWLPRHARRQGLAVSAYEAAIAYAEARGKTFVSDSAVSPAARHVYDALERRGYRVERHNPDALQERNLSRNLEGYYGDDQSGAPLYTVRAPNAPNGGASTPPRPPPDGAKSYSSSKPPKGGFRVSGEMNASRR